MTVHGTISVTHSNAGAGASVQGVCPQVWQAGALGPAGATAKIAAASQGHLGWARMTFYLQGKSWWRFSATRRDDAPPERGALKLTPQNLGEGP
jgi:hypothetical protein